MFVLSKGKPKTTNLLKDRKNKRKMENLNDKIKFSNGIETSVSELQMLIDSINDRDFELAGDLLKLWKYNADNFARETEQVTLERQIENERIRELKSDD